MTGRDNSVTNRVNSLVGNAGPNGSMPASDVRSFLESFARLGYGIDSLLSAAGLCSKDLNDREARISRIDSAHGRNPGCYGAAAAIRHYGDTAVRRPVQRLI